MVVFNVADSVTTELCIHHSNKNLTEGNSWGKALLDNNLFWVFQAVKQLLVLGIAAFAIKTRNKTFILPMAFATIYFAYLSINNTMLFLG